MNTKFFTTMKSFIIIGLAALAVYQVSRLWLVELMDGNFFFYLQARFPQAVPDGQSSFTRPYRIVSGGGSERLFGIRYSGIGGSEEWIYGENAIRAILQSGSFDGETEFSSILEPPILIYEYAFDMCAETFARALGRRNADLLTDAGIETFRAIAIRPPDPQTPLLTAYFISDTRAWRFTMPLSVPRQTDEFAFQVRSANPAVLHFIATPDGFLPQIPPGGFIYNRVATENPFRDPQGLFRITHIRRQVEPFFDNPSVIIPSAREVYTFTTRNTMIRYLENAVLEYTSFRTFGRTAQGNFMDDFSAALAFIASDPHVTNEVFLQNHEPRGRGHIFYFNYVIDNRPLVLTEEWSTGANCTAPLLSPIEITVEYGRVTRYRRLAYTFTIAEPARINPDVPDGFFSLGFPISSADEIWLSVILEE